MDLVPAHIEQHDDAKSLKVWVSSDTSFAQTARSGDGSFVAVAGTLLAGTSADGMLRSWLDTGEGAIESWKFHGFVVACNTSTGACVLARDRFGVEVGYFSETPTGIVFSDDLLAVRDLGRATTVDPLSLAVFLSTGYFVAPFTPFASVLKLEPGHLVHVAGRHFGTQTAWARYGFSRTRSRADARGPMKEALTNAISELWPTEGDAALLLSGGIDSAMLAVAIARYLDTTVPTYTFRYAEYDGVLNEGPRARVIAQHLGLPHEEITIRPEQLISDLDAAVAAYREPFTWAIHSYRLEPVARAGATVVFNGVGADGWGITQRHKAALRFSRLPGVARSFIRLGVRMARPLGLSLQQKAEWTTRRVAGVAELFSPSSAGTRQLHRSLYQDPTIPDRGDRRLLDLFEATATNLEDDLERSLIYMNKLLSSAEASLTWNRVWPLHYGMRACLPYYSPDVIEIGMNIEGDATGKDILRDLAEDALPTEVAQAPKLAQQMPISLWLRDPLSEAMRERLSSLPEPMNDVFDGEEVARLMAEHLEGHADHGWLLFALMTIASLYRNVAG